ncbi:NAD(P)/FAD-dependent oxidoreductase [Candidatus Chloroploca sp. Khr17]|uniref:phytoene desaturase family protein n=1 Tax=Candidatus Chloroploca sp. Khr17 TaxID=2496869 RepID=UPI00101C8C0F|nr:NAD(P)/FAD-dependent oxidoreductase [Candidatus Chloroploca sp. Khr17]
MRDRSPLRERYEVVVIGAGIGGLTAGALLAARGKDVLVLEQHYLPGGSAQTFPSGRYRFDVGPKLFFGMDQGRGNMRYHQEVFAELDEWPELSSYESYYTFRHPRGTLRIAGSTEEYLHELITCFPEEAAGIRAFYRRLEQLHELFVAMPNLPLDDPWTYATLLWRVPLERLVELNHWSQVTLGELFDRYIASPEVRSIINAEMIAFCYSDLDETPAVLGALVLIERHKGGGTFTKGGSGELAKLLIRGLEKHNGRISYRSPVVRIGVEDGRARGVVLGDGSRIRADWVISNAGVVNTFGRTGTPVEPLVDRRWVKPATRTRVDQLKITDSFITLFAGVDASVFPEGTDPHTLYIDHYAQTGNDLRMICFCNSSFKDPSLAPPGKHALQIVYFDPDYCRYDVWQRNDDYAARKAEATERALTMAEEVFPGIRAGIERLEVGTPLTYEDYLAKWGGGWGARMSVDQFAFQRFQHKTDIDRLLLVGADTHPGIGVVSVTMSGINCASLIARPR